MFELLGQTMLAMFGAVARQLQAKNKKSRKVIELISGSFVAAFIGVVIYFVTAELGINGNLAYATAAISGWLGPQVLYGITDTIEKRSGIKLTENKDKKGE